MSFTTNHILPLSNRGDKPQNSPVRTIKTVIGLVAQVVAGLVLISSLCHVYRQQVNKPPPSLHKGTGIPTFVLLCYMTLIAKPLGFTLEDTLENDYICKPDSYRCSRFTPTIISRLGGLSAMFHPELAQHGSLLS